MAHIHIQGLKYRYPESSRNALDHITLEIAPGEFIGVIGRNGAGKSTLCQAILGLVPNFYKGNYAGEVRIDSQKVTEVTVDELCQKVGLVFQNPFNQVTGSKESVYEEIAFGLENIGVPRDEMRERIHKSLALLGIEEYKERAPFDLSGGQMQRMAIASVIAMEPEVLILDEPTSQLDPQGRKEVFEAVHALSKQGITVIMVEQNMEQIAMYSDKVLLLDQGKSIDYDTPRNVFSRIDLEEYGVCAPIYTRLCKCIGLIEGTQYPITLEEVKQVWNCE